MKTPSFIIKLDKKLDTEIFSEALETLPHIVSNQFPQIKTKKDVTNAINYVYGKTDENKRLKETKKMLEKNLPKLQMIAETISRQLDHTWSETDTITIVPATSPIFPRFLNMQKFFVPYFWQKDHIFRIIAHEMVHILYFEKIQQALGKKIDTEYPSDDWLISEIIAPYLVNQPRMQEIVKVSDEFFTPEPNIISIKKIHKIEHIFNTEKDLLEFRKLALKEIRQE